MEAKLKVSGYRFTLLACQRNPGEGGKLTEVYGSDDLEDFRRHVQQVYPAACTSGAEPDGTEYVLGAWTAEDRRAVVQAIKAH